VTLKLANRFSVRKPWFSFFRVSGNSMSPEYNEGDFVLITRFPLWFHRLSINDVIVFRYEIHGLLIKKIQNTLPNGDVFVVGTQVDSLDSRKIGYIPKSAVNGKVIWHIRKPT
jgi:signal peptidase I